MIRFVQLMLKKYKVEQMDDEAVIDECLRALSDPVRRRIVEVLTTGTRRAGELATLVGVPPSSMSKHLRVLLQSGLVDDERSVVDARVRLFFLQREPLHALADWLRPLTSRR